jgi:hypothetical protein
LLSTTAAEHGHLLALLLLLLLRRRRRRLRLRPAAWLSAAAVQGDAVTPSALDCVHFRACWQLSKNCFAQQQLMLEADSPSPLIHPVLMPLDRHVLRLAKRLAIQHQLRQQRLHIWTTTAAGTGNDEPLDECLGQVQLALGWCPLLKQQRMKTKCDATLHNPIAKQLVR